MPARRLSTVMLGVALLVAGCGDDQPATSPWDDVDLGLVTEDWGCDYTLAGSDREQTIGVVLRAPAGMYDEGTTIDLADAEWRGTVQLGRDLFSEWCTSLLDDETRRPVVEQEADVIGGILTFTTPADADGCGGPDVAVSIAELEITTDDGDTHGLGSVALTSPLWGCQAG